MAASGEAAVGGKDDRVAALPAAGDVGAPSGTWDDYSLVTRLRPSALGSSMPHGSSW